MRSMLLISVATDKYHHRNLWTKRARTTGSTPNRPGYRSVDTRGGTDGHQETEPGRQEERTQGDHRREGAAVAGLHVEGQAECAGQTGRRGGSAQADRRQHAQDTEGAVRRGEATRHQGPLEDGP